MNIALDVMGGDYSPEAALKGAYSFLQENQDQTVVTLLGKKEIIESKLQELCFDQKKIQIVDCKDQIEDHLPPTEILKGKKESPIMVGMDLQKKGNIDAFVSAGNSGAIMATALLKLGCIHDIKRPAIGSVIPTLKGKKVILDIGANVDCKPIHLLQFALMGSAYARYELGINNPKVGLVNIGEEKSKGNRLVREAYQLMIEKEDLNFVGNIEGRDIFLGSVDVIVCDGFVGNIIIKTAEGLSSMFMTDFKLSMLRHLPDNQTSQMLKERFLAYNSKRNYKTYGAAPLLGVNGLCFICHGRSKGEAIKNALHNASTFVSNKGLEHLNEINFNLE